MTGQMHDQFRLRGELLALVGHSVRWQFHPELFGLEPREASTACWRGYLAVFGLSGSRLVLEELHINLPGPGGGNQRKEGPLIDGIRPTGPEEGEGFLHGPTTTMAYVAFEGFNNHYVGMNHHLAYTGGLLIGENLITGLYVHQGFQPAWKFETVIELIFEDGVLRRECNRSRQMAEIREWKVGSNRGLFLAGEPLPDDLAQLLGSYWL